jgi:hypothetical protein
MKRKVSWPAKWNGRRPVIVVGRFFFMGKLWSDEIGIHKDDP